MNTKTTLLLAVFLLALGGMYYAVRSRPAPVDDLHAPLGAPGSALSRDLLEQPLGEVVKVVLRQKGQEEWIFEKERGTESSAPEVWRLTSPQSFRCVSWEVNKFETRLASLRYEISFTPDVPGAASPARAGLDPPEATVTLTDADGESITIEVGRPVSRRETYVRLAGSNEIVVAKADLRDLFKERLLDFRERELWQFDAADVTRVEIVDRTGAEPIDYVVARDGTRWMMESPITSRATEKVGEMLQAMGRLRALSWVDDDPGRLPVYGLEPPALTVRATTEQQRPKDPDSDDETVDADAPQDAPADAGDASAEDEPDAEPAETIVTHYELHLSSASPIGEETKTYMRIGDESAVATVMKSTADKFKPDMATWRDMRITPANVSDATQIELYTSEGSAVLVKRHGQWRFEAALDREITSHESAPADETAVRELLEAIKELMAVSFIDEPSRDLSEYGLDEPRAQIRLRIPGSEDVERISVGGYTEPAAQHLTFVRRGEAAVAKVRTADVEPLIRSPLFYRDRTVIDVLPARFEKIALSVENPLLDGQTRIVLERIDETWTMVEPVRTEARTTEVDSLVAALGNLRAERVVADESRMSAFGLHAPAVTASLVYALTPSTPSEPPSHEEDDADEDEDDELKPDRRTIVLDATAHDGRYFARRRDRSSIYEISEDVYSRLTAEYRTDRVMTFDETHAVRFAIQDGEVVHAFIRDNDLWAYEAEPDLPLDQAAVKNLLLQIGDLRTPRYVQHTQADPSAFGLDAPTREITVAFHDESTQTLRIASETAEGFGQKGHFSAVADRPGVFLLTADMLQRTEVSLEELLARE